MTRLPDLSNLRDALVLYACGLLTVAGLWLVASVLVIGYRPEWLVALWGGA